MKHWRRESILLGKGSRSPRDSANFQHKEKQTAKRKLQVLNGGDPTAVTHRETRRRGSRLRNGEIRGSRKAGRRQCELEGDGDWKEAVVDLDEYRRAHPSPSTAPSGTANDPSAVPVQSTTAEQSSPEPATTASVEIEPEPAKIWTMEDFTEKAIEADKERWRSQTPTHAETREFRQKMEFDFERKRQEEMGMVRKLLGGGRKPTKAAQTSSTLPDLEKCVHHLQFENPSEVEFRAGPAVVRPTLQGSHSRSSAAVKKRRTK